MANKLYFQVKWEDSDVQKIDFEVISFEAREAISESYEFKIKLRSMESLTRGNLLGRRGIFTIQMESLDNEQKPKKSIYHGIIFAFDSSEQIGHDYYYEVTLAPKLAKLKYSKKSDVYVQSSLKEILQSVLNEQYEFTDDDLFLSTTLDDTHYQAIRGNAYNRYGYVCQYEESDHNFINRLMERDGVYYYFEQGADQEKIVITDTKDQYVPRGEVLHLRQQNTHYDANSIDNIKCKHEIVASEVIIKNFCYERAHLGDRGVISCSASVGGSENEGNLAFLGEELIYGENFINADPGGDGDFLAKTRAAEIFCQSKRYIVKSTALPVYPGRRVTINDDRISEFNGEYLVLEVLHAGYQETEEMSTTAASEIHNFYENTLVLIPANVQFRPQRKTPWPKIDGTMNGLIDGEGESLYPQLDNNGRYKVRLPFLKNTKADGKGSIWLRLATPYAGDGCGLHFPLQKGTEVVLSFRDGNPDLPVIMGAVFNSLHKNVVVNKNAYMGGLIVTPAGNVFLMNDTAGAHAIGLKTNNNWKYFQ